MPHKAYFPDASPAEKRNCDFLIKSGCQFCNKKMKRQKCEECGGKIKKTKVEFSLYGQSLGSFPAEVCTQCGEELFDEETSDKIDQRAKEKGLWGTGSKSNCKIMGKVTTKMIRKTLLYKCRCGGYVHSSLAPRLHC